MLRQGAGSGACSLQKRAKGSGPIEARIGARRDKRLAVDVAGDDLLSESSRRRDRQHARAGTDVEYAPRPPPPGQRVERKQAAARGTVVAGAEGERGFDLDADGVHRHAPAVMRAMHDEAAGAHRLQAREALRHPIGGGDLLEAERLRRCFARRPRDQCAHRGLIDTRAEMDRHLPLPAAALESRADGIIEYLTDQGGDRFGGRLVDGEAGNVGRGIGHAARRFALRICARNGYVAAMSIEIPTTDDTDALALASRSGWPESLRVLLAKYPREQWQRHANLGEMARFWLSRHDMFRELAAMIREIETEFREGRLPAAEFPRQFVPRLQFLLSQLGAHHQIEDFHYFPIFRAADERLARGFDVLEDDHHAIHADMARVAETANALLRALTGDKDALRHCGDAYAAASGALLAGLLRHLDDEEDLIVPLILDRGEEALGVGH